MSRIVSALAALALTASSANAFKGDWDQIERRLAVVAAEQMAAEQQQARKQFRVSCYDRAICESINSAATQIKDSIIAAHMELISKDAGLIIAHGDDDDSASPEISNVFNPVPLYIDWPRQ
jgi:hypothetical protein